MTTIYPGQSGKFNFTAKYKGGDPILPDNITSLKLVIIIDGVIQAKFKYGEAEEGWEELTVETSPKLTGKLERSMTKNWPTGKAQIHVVQKTVVQGFDNGFFDQSTQELFEVIPHPLNNETL